MWKCRSLLWTLGVLLGVLLCSVHFHIGENYMMSQNYEQTKDNHSSSECITWVKQTKSLLENSRETQTFSHCKILKVKTESECQRELKDQFSKSKPENVFIRSLTCDIDWPVSSSVNDVEQEFPLAFFFTVFMDARNLEQQLATMFRPHNSYCIHIDPTADEIFKETVLRIIKCYKNRHPYSSIFASSRSIPVFWGDISIVEAELICLRDLEQYKWKYAINMAGSEVMLQTNKELVYNLTSSNITERAEIYAESFPMPWQFMERVNYKWAFNKQASDNFDPDKAVAPLHKMNEKPDLVPFELKIYKGMKSYKLPRWFVEFYLHHPVAQTFLNWTRTMFIPDESVVQTLVRISSMEFDNGTWIVEQNYEPQPNHHLQYFDIFGWECNGRWRNHVCVFGLKDLSQILSSGKHIANKVRTDYDPTIGSCLADIVQERYLEESKEQLLMLSLCIFLIITVLSAQLYNFCRQ